MYEEGDVDVKNRKLDLDNFRIEMSKEQIFIEVCIVWSIQGLGQLSLD